MKRTWTALALAGAMVFQLAACGASNSGGGSSSAPSGEEAALVLSDQSVTLDGNTISEGTDGAVTVSHDIVYYQAGQGEDYGAGSADDEHTAEEAGAHTVVTIRKAGTYRVSGSLSAGQLAVDLGDDAKTAPSSVVTLILDGVDITCTVAPAVIFYNVYECDADFVAYDNEETDNYVSSPTVDTSAAGANVILADGSVNNISGSYVARIYKEGTTKKLHKYDGAFCLLGKLEGARARARKPEAVVVAHHALDDGKLAAAAVFREQVAQCVIVKEKGIEIRTFRADDPAVEHGVNVVRAAFCRGDVASPVHKRLQNGAGNGRFAAAAVGSGENEPRKLRGHRVTLLVQ